MGVEVMRVRSRLILLIIAMAVLLLLPTGCFKNNKVSGHVLIAGGTREYARNALNAPNAAALSEWAKWTERAGRVIASDNQHDHAEWEIPNQFIVRYAFPEALIRAEVTAHSLSGQRISRSGRTPAPDLAVFSFPDQTTASTARQRIQAIPGIIAIQPNYLVRTQSIGALQPLVENDRTRPGAQIGAQSGAQQFLSDARVAPADLWNLSRIRVPGAWDITSGNPEIIVAIIDTGFKLDHPGLQDRWTAFKYDYVMKDTDPSVDNPSGANASHGTHVAGIIAAADLGLPVVGIAPRIRLMPLRVLNDNGNGTLLNIRDAIYDAVDHGAAIINLSLGTLNTDLLDEAIEYAHDHGVLLIAASGNGAEDGEPILYPASHPLVVAVGAVDANDRRAVFSNHGPQIDVVAPGTEYFHSDSSCRGILSTIVKPDGASGYGYLSGTSMSVPHVSALAALLASTGISDPDAKRSWIRGTAIDLGPSGTDNEYGYGRIDALNAVALPFTRVSLRAAPSGEPAAGPLAVNPDASFHFPHCPDGKWLLTVWVDSNFDLAVNSGDYYGELSTLITIPGNNDDLLLAAGRIP